MDIKEVKAESFLPDFCSENERELFIKDLVKKVKIETATSSSDIKPELEEGSTCSQNEGELLIKHLVKKVKIETESCINDDIKNETHEDFYSTKPPRLVPEVKNSSITCSSNFEMDTIKEEESLPDGVAPQNEIEFFRKVVTMKRNSDAMLLEDHCGMPIKTEIKSEAPFTKHLVKRIKSEAVICSNNWEIDRKAVINEQILISDFGSQSEEELLSENPVAKLRKFNSDPEMGSKIEIKEESLWLETETSDVCDDIEVGDFPPVKSSRLCTQGLSSTVSAKLLLIPAEVSGRGTSFSPGQDNPEYKHQKRDDTQIARAEEHVLSQQSSTCSEKKDMYIRPLNLKQKTTPHQHKRPHKYETSDKSCLADLKTHSLIHDGKKPHKCKSCDKSFTRLSHMKEHYLIHEGRKPYQCKTCDKSFNRLGTLKTHYLIHEGKKPHKCKTCEKRFTRLADLKTHYLIHDGKKPHKCKSCDKSFTRLSHMKEHYLIHEGKKPHHCETCDKSFTRLSYLKKHYLTHESKKTHQCKTCDRSFTRLRDLKTHYLIHVGKKPHLCKTCNKSFTRLGDLKTHYLIHEGTKPHKCETCNKSFTRLGYLKTHYLIHEGRKPHKCKTCNKSFRTLSNLKRHYSIHDSKK